MKHLLLYMTVLLGVLLLPQGAKCQIGYQVALLHAATGEPRAGETVNVTLTITNAEDKVVYTGVQRATTNDFGVLSLTVGDAHTFEEVDWNKLPFFISASVDGVLIGKSQLLNVPVAEYAKAAGPVLTKEMLVGTWGHSWTERYQNEEGEEGIHYRTYVETYAFKPDGSYIRICHDSGYDTTEQCEGAYEIIGNNVITYETSTSMWGEVISQTTSYGIQNALTYSSSKDILIPLNSDLCVRPYIRQSD